MSPESNFDYAKPFDVMVGMWSGLSTSFSPKGEYLCSVPSFVYLYWHSPTVLHYRQDELPDLDRALVKNQVHLDALTKIIHHDFDLKISGKACVSSVDSKNGMRVVGTETRPGVYLFHLMFKEGDYYNNQYFTNPERASQLLALAAKEQSRDVARGFAQIIAKVDLDAVGLAEPLVALTKHPVMEFRESLSIGKQIRGRAQEAPRERTARLPEQFHHDVNDVLPAFRQGRSSC